MKFELNTFHRNTSDEELLDDLKKVATKLGKDTISWRDYSENGKFNPATLGTRFGNWNTALEKAGLVVGIQQNITDEELFKNIEDVWIKLGRQPLYAEIKRPLSKYTPSPYQRRFGNWRKALEAFIEFINSGEDQNEEIIEEIPVSIQENEIAFKHKSKRQPSERLKVQVLMRDGNKCRLCGITVTGDNIHFDHILAWSKGGETVLENLQVLCSKHNLAKSNLEYPEK